MKPVNTLINENAEHIFVIKYDIQREYRHHDNNMDGLTSLALITILLVFNIFVYHIKYRRYINSRIVHVWPAFRQI